MELMTVSELEKIINQKLYDCELTRGLKINIWKSPVVFEDGNNWASYIEPYPEHRESYQPTAEAKKMIQKLLGDMRLKYNVW
jgi:hypothetical protein